MQEGQAERGSLSPYENSIFQRRERYLIDVLVHSATCCLVATPKNQVC